MRILGRAVNLLFRRFGITRVYPNSSRNIESDLSQLLELPIEHCIDLLGRSFSLNGGNHWVEFLKEHTTQSIQNTRDSNLHKYYSEFTRRDALKILFSSDYLANKTDEFKQAPNLFFPWSTGLQFQNYVSSSTKTVVHGNPESDYWGPKTTDQINQEYKRTVAIYTSIVRNGYTPELCRDKKRNLPAYPFGILLKHGKKYRFLILSGKHKISVLSVLGYRTVLVKPRPHGAWCHATYPLIVDSCNTKNWPCVTHGIYTEEEAKELLMVYFRN